MPEMELGIPKKVEPGFSKWSGLTLGEAGRLTGGVKLARVKGGRVRKKVADRALKTKNKRDSAVNKGTNTKKSSEGRKARAITLTSAGERLEKPGKTFRG